MAHKRTFQHGLGITDPTMKNVDVPQKVHHKFRGWMVKNICRRTDLFDSCLIHHHDSVGNFQRLFLVMRDQDGCGVEFVVKSSQPFA